ncbi:MAG: ABC transporter substrate-binding protein [Alphaproteobacteria bacterium]|nr:ABC transporter substrate-binding protein [Alphaproteobacteria bacterium]
MRISPWMLAGALFLAPFAVQAQPLRVALEFDPAPLDPATDGSYTNRVVTTLMCDSLIDLTPDLKFVPELATSWEWSADRLSLTLKLRPGVLFQDGTPFDAAAMAANIERYKTVAYSTRKAEMAAISGAEVIDPLTLRVNLSRPYAPLIMLLANRPGTPYSPKILGLSREEIANKPVCAGPFAFKARVVTDHITLERFPGYWNAGAIKFSSVVFRTITDVNIRKVDLAAGALEVSQSIAPTDVASVSGNAKMKVAKSPSLGFVPIEFNVGNGKAADTPLGRDPRVRRAFSLAIDRAVLNQVAFEGQYVPSNQMEAPGSTYFHPGHPVPARDVDAAKKQLAEAGVKTVAFTLRIGTDPLDEQVAQIVQAMVKDAGFEMKILKQDAAALVAATQSGDFEASMLLWSGRADPDGNLPLWVTSKGFVNWGKYNNPKLDDVLTQATTVGDIPARQAFYRQAVDIFMNDQPHVILYHYSKIWGLSGKLQGFAGRPDGLWRPEGMSLAP